MKKLKFSQFGVMSVNYQLYSLSYALASIAGAGFRYVDLWGGAPHYSWFDTAPGQRDRRIGEIRRLLDDNGLKVSVFTAEQICLYPINVASSNPYVRRNSLEIVKGYLEDTKALGAAYFFPQMGYCLFDEDEEAAYARSIEALREINAYAERLGVKMVMEQLQRYESNLCYNRATLKRLIDAVGSPNLTACIDCVAAAAGGESLDTYFDAFGTVNHLHLADGCPEGHLVPGEGSNDINGYLAALVRHRYTGTITMEINNQLYFDDPDAATRKTVEWLRRSPWIDMEH